MSIVVTFGLVGGIALSTLYTIASAFLNWWPEAAVFKTFAQQHQQFLPKLPPHVSLKIYMRGLPFHFGLGFFIGALAGALYVLVKKALLRA